jgi:HlyD family secretion protein
MLNQNKRRKRSKVIIVFVMLVIVSVISAYVYHVKTLKKEAKYETARTGKGNIEAKVTATGTLSALVTVQVGSQVSGRLLEILVDFNSAVKKGDVLARIDPQFFKAALEQAKANLIAAQSNLEKARIQAEDARRQMKRAEMLAAKGLVSQAEIDTATTNAGAADAQVLAAKGAHAQAKAGMEQAKINLEYTTIFSPINGIVISRNVDVGQTVAASFQAPTLFTIAEDLRRMQVDTSVSESDVGKLKADMEASFTVDAYPYEKFSGKIRQIRNSPQIVQNVVTYDAVIDVENPELKLKPGMTASVTFIYAKKEGVVIIPNAALRFNPSSEISETGKGEKKFLTEKNEKNTEKTPDQRNVWILKQGEAVKIPVRTGITDGSMTEIVSDDIKEGDDVITGMSKNGADKLNTQSGKPPGPFPH